MEQVLSRNFVTTEWIAARCAGRMRVLMDLSAMLSRGRVDNCRSLMRQGGWQSWLLDLVLMPHSPLIVTTNSVLPSGSTGVNVPSLGWLNVQVAVPELAEQPLSSDSPSKACTPLGDACWGDGWSCAVGSWSASGVMPPPPETHSDSRLRALAQSNYAVVSLSRSPLNRACAGD